MADREKVVDGLTDLKRFLPSTMWEPINDAIALLKEQETQRFFVDESGKITPLPVVVRCKDCKHGRQYDTNAIDCEYRELATEPDWFCADGERQEGR